MGLIVLLVLVGLAIPALLVARDETATHAQLHVGSSAVVMAVTDPDGHAFQGAHVTFTLAIPGVAPITFNDGATINAIAIQRLGWRVAYDIDAVAWTEAPQSFGALAKQRFRWAFGTLQCLWKHRRLLRERRPRGLALIGMPQAWLFQIIFSLVSPMIDLALLFSIVMTWGRVQQHGWAQTHTDLGRMAFFWALFVTVDLICGWIAFRMDKREQRFPGLLLLPAVLTTASQLRIAVNNRVMESGDARST